MADEAKDKAEKDKPAKVEPPKKEASAPPPTPAAPPPPTPVKPVYESEPLGPLPVTPGLPDTPMNVLFSGATTLPSFGVNTHPTYNTGPPDADNVSMAQTLGVSVIRLDGAYWANIETVVPTATSAATTSGNVLHFTSVPGGVADGMLVADSGNASVIPVGTTVSSFTTSTVTLSNNVTGGGVASGDKISFYGFTGDGPTCIAAFADAGFVIDLILLSNNVSWASTTLTAITTTANIDAFCSYAAATAYYYSNLYGASTFVFELLNEENFNTNWAPTANASQYATLADAAAVAIKAAVPGAKVLVGGLTFGGSGFIAPDTYIASFVASATLSNFVGVGAHPYNQTNPEQSITDVENFSSAMSADLPVWTNEVGYTLNWVGGSETTRAIYIAELLLCAIVTKPQPVNLSIYDLYMNETQSGDPTDYDNDFGLFANTTYDILPSGTAVASITAACAGVVTNSASQSTDKDIYQVVINKVSDTTYITWSVLETHYFTQTVEAYTSISATDVFGNIISLTIAGSQVSYVVSPSVGPVILVVN